MCVCVCVCVCVHVKWFQSYLFIAFKQLNMKKNRLKLPLSKVKMAKAAGGASTALSTETVATSLFSG